MPLDEGLAGEAKLPQKGSFYSSWTTMKEKNRINWSSIRQK
jgi:hypothetical protein